MELNGRICFEYIQQIKLSTMSAIEKCTFLTQNHFRQHCLAILLRYTPQSVKISRLSLFQAVSILDKYIHNLNESEVREAFQITEILPVSLACLTMGIKFLGDRLPKIQKLGEVSGWTGDYDALVANMLEIEFKIFKTIGFMIPKDTAISDLLQKMDEREIPNHQLAVLLKILLIGLEYSSDLSMNPEYGSRIYGKLILRKKDPAIKTFLKKATLWSQSYQKPHPFSHPAQ